MVLPIPRDQSPTRPPTQPPASPRSPLLAVAVAFAAGIACDLCLSIPSPGYLALAAVLLLATLLGRRYRRHRLATSCLLMVVACVGALRHHASVSLARPSSLARFVGESRQLVRIEGVIATTPVIRLPPRGSAPHQRPTTRWDLRAETIRRRISSEPLTGRLWVIARDRVTGLQVGDRVSLIGWLERPSPARNPGGFDMQRMLKRRGVAGVLVIGTSRSVNRLDVSREILDRCARRLASFRRSGQRLLAIHLSPRTAPVAAALLLGVRDDLDRGHREMFIRSGTMHLLAISGLHVGLLAGLVWMIARLVRLGPTSTATLIVVCVILYALLAELRPSVLRAAILVTLTVTGRPHRRCAAAANSLALAALIVLGLCPGDLQSQGAQLSFLAVATLAWSAPRAAAWVPVTSSNGSLGRLARRTLQAWLIGMAIWCTTAPLIASAFGLVAPVGLLINVLMIPLVGASLWLGVALLGCAGWMPGAGLVLGRLLDLLLGLILNIAETSAAGPLAFVAMPAPPTGWLVTCYVLLALVAASSNPRTRSLWLVGLAATLAVGLTIALQPTARTHLQLVVLDAGHGGAILLECPNGRTLLFDAGTLGDPDRLADTIRKALWHHRRRQIDAVVLSHPDRDHFSAASPLMERIPVGSLVASHTFLNPKQPETLDLFRLAAEQRVAIELVVAGDRLRLDPQVSIVVRHPPEDFVGSTDNSNSVVLEIGFAGRTILLTGDLEDEGQGRLMNGPEQDFDILLSPHHGSPQANRLDWARWTRPEWVLVSGGRTSTKSVLGRTYGSQSTVVATRRRGAIGVRITEAGTIRVTTAIPDRSR